DERPIHRLGTMTEQGNAGETETLTPREVIKRFHDYGLALELEREADLFAEDGVAEWPMAPAGSGRRAGGPGEVRAILGPSGARSWRAVSARGLGAQSRRPGGLRSQRPRRGGDDGGQVVGVGFHQRAGDPDVGSTSRADQERSPGGHADPLGGQDQEGRLLVG